MDGSRNDVSRDTSIETVFRVTSATSLSACFCVSVLKCHVIL
jgi:hypothetical protein